MQAPTVWRFLCVVVLGAALGACGLSDKLPDTEDAPAALQIGKVQGNGPRSPHEGERVVIQGVVTGNFVNGLQGFFMQDAVGEEDGDPNTSDGIFVAWSEGSEPKVRRGDRVRVAGEVVELERGGSHQTSVQASGIEVLGRGAAAVTDIDAAPASMDDWERHEGMWLRINTPMTVVSNDGLLRFGELGVSFSGRRFVPTEQHPPGANARRAARKNARNQLLLDDSRDGEYVGEPWYLTTPLSSDTPMRVGSVVHGVEGILHHAWGWRLQLTEPLADIEQAPRPAAPELPDGIRIAGFNVYNWFNGDGRGGGFPTPRGAETAEEMHRQRDKLVAAINELRPDIAALMEVENDGFDPDSSIAQLVSALNEAWPEAGYRFVDAGHGPGDDVMRVAMIYRDDRVQPEGEALTLAEGVFSSRNRVPLAQSFRALGSNAVFNVVANHFKSKRCDEAEEADADRQDGQACWAALRAEAALELDRWLHSTAFPDHALGSVILGDLNSYAQEDPLRALRNAGWRDAFAESGVSRPYSFVYRGQSGRLDHALLSKGLLSHLRGAAVWHINADESPAFDYRKEHRDPLWYAADPYRSSDHDPLILVLNFDED